MRKGKITLLVALVFLPWVATTLRAQEAKRVLFVGNSYTEVNDLPRMVAEVAASMGDVLTYGSNTPGGCTFQQHCTNQTMALIRQGGWDAVVLQEQSQYPSFPDSQVQAEVFPYARRLVDSIYAHGWCSEPMFYMTWGRRDGDSYNAQFFPPLATYEGMDSLLCARYLQMAAANDASVCPVGRVWRYLRRHHPALELYQTDGSHPSVAGTYAAACSFYTMLFHRNPVDIAYRPDALTPAQAQTIRQAVGTVVYDSLSGWQRRRPALQVTDIDTPQYMGCAFAVEGEHCDTVRCFWGDGSDTTFAQTAVVRHTYAAPGSYTVTFTASRHCLDTVVVRTLHVNQEGIPDLQPPTSGLRVYPNPANDRVHVGVPAELVLYSLDGRRLRRCHADTLPLEGLASGGYLLTVDGEPIIIIKR
jgi:hypothetical protein